MRIDVVSAAALLILVLAYLCYALAKPERF
jgi:K+-transporting ATPase KdpF subunit